jgi:hypothetical protein
VAANAAVAGWASTNSGGATPIATVGGTGNIQITLPVAGDYFVQFQTTKRANNNAAILQVYTGADCSSTAQSILGEAASSALSVTGSGIVRTAAANTTLQICQKGTQSITAAPAVAGSVTGMLTVMRVN